jgi:predicted DNA-binding protein (MmcQ/YjbR family)
MAKTSPADSLDRLSALCLALPEAKSEDKGDHMAFLVRRKIFAYYLNDHHGDGIVSVCCKVLPGENQQLVNANSRSFYLPAYIASRGWVGLRLDLPRVNWSEVKELVTGSYLQVAPKTLAARLPASSF